MKRFALVALLALSVLTLSSCLSTATMVSIIGVWAVWDSTHSSPPPYEPPPPWCDQRIDPIYRTYIELRRDNRRDEWVREEHVVRLWWHKDKHCYGFFDQRGTWHSYP